ncbi:Triacylglycerol lipase [Trypanosoma melophagium]|uniref:Triacylglycerol lipase n=1 Tax=Trypanosoma melophagium TaxID=715481 RepID=UPI003519D998|nr:Triacylglycerol lipase [Trypanosoma melophagium]
MYPQRNNSVKHVGVKKIHLPQLTLTSSSALVDAEVLTDGVGVSSKRARTMASIPRMKKNVKQNHHQARVSTKSRRARKKERPWFAGVIAFLYFLVVRCLILAPLHVMQKWMKEYSERMQSRRTEQRYLDIMNSTDSLETWFTAATNLDNHRGMQEWRTEISEKTTCNAEGLLQDALCARALALSQNERAMGEFLRSQLHRTAHGITNPYNYRYYTGTTRYVENYNSAIVKLIQTFSRASSNEKIFTTSIPHGEVVENSNYTPETSTVSEKGSEQKYWSETEFCDVEGHLDSATDGDGDSSCRTTVAFRPKLSCYLSSLLHWAYEPHPPSKKCLTDIEKLKVLEDALRSYGRSALMLSGGSTLGVYHTGVVRALFDAGLLPDIISGSSAGSIIAALICTKSEEQLRVLMRESVLTVQTLQLEPFDDGGFFQGLKRRIKTGALMDVRTLMECLRTNLGDLTFEEAYHKTGRILNVCVTSDQYSGSHMDRHTLLNYVTSPNVVVWSAVSASCALPGLFTAVQLIEKRTDGSFHRFLPGQLWCDGSLARDLPRESLSALFNVNYFIVSQVNPHIIPFLRKPASPLVYKQQRPRKILSRIWYGFCREVRHWVLKLFNSGLLSKTGKFELPYLSLTQCYDGDILILPIGNVLHAVPDYFNIVANPSPEYIAFVTSKAQLRTWPHLNQIRHSTMIERAILHEITLLKERVGNAEKKND